MWTIGRVSGVASAIGRRTSTPRVVSVRNAFVALFFLRRGLPAPSAEEMRQLAHEQGLQDCVARIGQLRRASRTPVRRLRPRVVWLLPLLAAASGAAWYWLG